MFAWRSCVCFADWRFRRFHPGAVEPAGRQQKEVSYPLKASTSLLFVRDHTCKIFSAQGAGPSGETHMWDVESEKTGLHSCDSTSCDKVNEVTFTEGKCEFYLKHGAEVPVVTFFPQCGAVRYVWQGGVWTVGPRSGRIQPHDVRLLQRCQVRCFRQKWQPQEDYSELWVMCVMFCFFNSPGPSSPLPWVRDCVLQLAPNAQWRQKILLGLNLYGLDFATQGTEPILGGRWDGAGAADGILYVLAFRISTFHRFSIVVNTIGLFIFQTSRHNKNMNTKISNEN